MAIVFLIRDVLLLSVLVNSVSTTRFLPSLMWDNVNPLLCCPYNWLVVPRVDLHDILNFVCPTSKLIVKQLNFNTRIAETMNFNLFRREWTGSIQNFQNSIADGSIHSFCNVSHPDSVKLHTCENGKYGSFPVKFTHFVFEPSREKYEKYEKDKTYVFYSNGDGLVSSLDSKEAKCNMLFAVHTTEERSEFAITYGKEVVPSKCECNPLIKPTLHPTTTKSTPVKTSTPTHQPTTVQSPTTKKKKTTTVTTPTTTTTTPSTAATSKKHTTMNEKIKTLKNIEALKTTKPADIYTETENNWLSIPIFVAITVAVFIFGVLFTVVFFQFCWKYPMRKDYDVNHKYYPHQPATPDGTISERVSNV